ncbi:hypothetical protein [Celeribacter marinus]|uniref:hypothetical protein n=1 Tax=Celeribacter marinus TaxID=1397108 RepID=UPI00078192C5|nr:hypothetical protein [Celeribacter marinus]SFK80563.1 hypothetical protein SAMN05444421_108186 [Celeribacter marinus]
MAHKPEVRLKKLRKIAAKLAGGAIVQNRQLRAWLTEEDFASYVQAWSDQKELRAELKDKPDEVREYEARLRKATFVYNKGEGASTRGKSKVAQKHFAQADTLFERLHVYLDEIIAADAGLRLWFDRDTDSSTLGLTPGTVPMVITSRSLESDGGGLLSNKRSKRDLKLDVVEWAIRGLEREAAGTDRENTSEAKSRLEEFLKQMEDDEF